MSLKEKTLRLKRDFDEVHASGINKGYDEGYAKGKKKGHYEGYNTGYDKGYGVGHTKGYENGYSEGEAAGIEAGKQLGGYAEGEAAGIEIGKQEAEAITKALIDRSISGDYIIPEGVTEIGVSAFQYCRKLTSVKIPESVVSLGASAFGETYLTELVLPMNCSVLKSYALSTMRELVTLKAGDLKNIANNAFTNNTKCILYDFSKCTQVPTLRNVNAFSDINAEAKILVPAELYDEWIVATNWTEIADYIAALVSEGLYFDEGFYGGYAVLWGIGECTDSVIIIPSTWNSYPVKEIMDMDQGYINGVWTNDIDVSHITTVKIPASVDCIYQNAFKGCTSLTEVDFSKHTAVPTLQGTAFEDVAGMKILVPSSLIVEWATATNWTYYADKIIGV